MAKKLVKSEGQEQQSIAFVLRPLRRKLWLKNIIYYVTRGLLFGICVAVLQLIAARLFPIWYAWRWAFLIVGGGFTVGLLLGLWRRPDVMDAARFADREGLQERMVTALSFQNDVMPMAALQREQAVVQFRREEEKLLNRLSMWRFPRWMSICLTLCVLVAAMLWFLPNPMDDVVKQQQRMKRALTKQAQTIAEEEDKIAQNDALTEEQQEALQEQLQKLRDQLADSKNVADGMDALAETEAELERLAERAANEQQSLDQLQAQLAANAATRELAEALAEMDGVKLREAMQDARDALERLTEEEQEALAEQLARTASELANSSELSSEELIAALQKASNGLLAGDIGLTSDALRQAVSQAIADGQAIAAMMDAADQAAVALANSKQALAQVEQPSTAGTVTAQNNGVSGQNNSNGNNSVNGTSGTSGQNNGTGNSHGSGSGTGQENGGTGNNGNGSGSSGGGSGGSGAGLGRGSRELVSVPSSRLEGGGPEETVGGPLGEGAETVQSQGSAIGSPGVNRPYTEVFGQYEQAARQALQRSDLPPQYQQLIKDYFTDIKPKE